MKNDAITLDRNEYNAVNLSLKEGILNVNRNEKLINLPSEINGKDLIITIGDKKEGFTGGLSNIIINNK